MPTPILLLALQAAALLAPLPTRRITRLQAASTRRRPLHRSPDLEQDGYLEVGDGHEIYYQVKTLKKNFGEPLPTALWLHGGPGAGCYPNHARFFDPEKWRIVLLDQRGCGKSKYTGECWDSNDTPRLVHDLELVRTHLNLTKWDCVQGGSWGSTLALAYAQSHPSSVRSLVLRGVCLMRPLEIDWLFSPNGGAASLAPKGYAAFRKHVSLEEGCDDRDVLHAYYERFKDSKTRDAAARAWAAWEGAASSISRRSGVATFSKGEWAFEHSPEYQEYMANRTRDKVASLANRTQSEDYFNGTTVPELGSTVDKALPKPKRQPAQPMLTCAYSVKNGFLHEDSILSNIDKIRDIPCIAVQGAADPICPPRTAYDLHKAWPEMELVLVAGGGHSQYDPDVQHELLEATDRMHGRLADAGPAPTTKRGGGRPSTRLYASARDDDGAPATKTRFVLVQTRHPGNVGAAARALLTMGFDELCLVDPADRGVLNRKKAVDGASGARGILERAKIEDSLAAALEGFDLRCATGMPTDMSRARSTQVFREPRAFFEGLKGDTGSIAFVFGNERMGMTEEDMSICDVVLGVPTNPNFGSLNLASAVQLVAYDWRQALGGFPSRVRTTNAARGRASTRLYATARDDVVSVDSMHDDAEARSQFGTKAYWDDMYRGLGDFDEEAYEWYFGWPDIKPYFQEHVHTTSKILIPGMGNDPLLLDLVGAGYGDITAFDYSEGAVARQAELLAYDANAEDAVTLLCRDARALDEAWTGAFDAILEKGCLDALYLSDDTDGNVRKAAEELRRVLKPGGIFMSVSGVVPADLRREICSTEKYDWIRDGTEDLKAGCFVWRKR